MSLTPTARDFVDFMVETEGASREQALEFLLVDPTAPERIGTALTNWKAEREARAEAERQAAHAATPEGRREAALAAAKAQAERAELAQSARILLAQEGHGTVSDLSDLDDDAVLRAAGIEAKRVSEMSFAEKDAAEQAFLAEYDSLDPVTRAERGRELGISPELVTRLRAGDQEGSQEGGEGGA